MNKKKFFLQAYEILRGSKTEDETLNKMLELIGNTPFKSEDLKIAGILFYKKLRAANMYKASNKYEGPITLIKAKDNFVSLNNDYGLSEVNFVFIHLITIISLITLKF